MTLKQILTKAKLIENNELSMDTCNTRLKLKRLNLSYRLKK